MANTQGVPTYNGFRTRAHGVLCPTSGIKCALYLVSATTGPTNTAYTATGEVSGSGYSAGGVTVTTGTVPAITGSTTYWTPNATISFGTVTLSTAFDCFMLYDTGQSNANIFIGTFSSQAITAAAFSITMPTNDSSTALMRLAWS
jgi:hypothetical protein